MQHTGSLIRSLVKGLGLEGPTALHEIKSRWAGLFTGPLPLHCCPVSLRDGELLINVDSPVWRQQLDYLSAEMAGKLASFGAKRLRFKLGKVDKALVRGTGRYGRGPLRPAAGLSERAPLGDEDLFFIEHAASFIADKETREAAIRAAKKSLQAQGPGRAGP